MLAVEERVERTVPTETGWGIFLRGGVSVIIKITAGCLAKCGTDCQLRSKTTYSDNGVDSHSLQDVVHFIAYFEGFIWDCGTEGFEEAVRRICWDFGEVEELQILRCQLVLHEIPMFSET